MAARRGKGGVTVVLELEDARRLHALFKQIREVAGRIHYMASKPALMGIPHPVKRGSIEAWLGAINYFHRDGLEDAERLLELVEECKVWIEVLLERSAKGA